jgi:predicted AAA+ superfamily ATPase
VFPRLLLPPRRSFFLFGPRGTGKSTWLRARLPGALTFDLLDHRVYSELVADPARLGDRIPKGHRDWVVVDEVQRAPELLNEVHRLIESRRLRFALTGSSARKLRRRGVNLLAGRAATCRMHPLSAMELGESFDLGRALRLGGLPEAWTSEDPEAYLGSYAATYLREEVLQEGLARDVGVFARFLETASLSQACVLNMASVARECGVSAKVAEGYFGILDDLLIGVRLPVFSRRAKRRLVAHPKFHLFDAGVFQAVRPRGPLDPPGQIQGAALETLFLSNLRAVNDGLGLGYSIHYWRTAAGDEVDFVLYGPRGLHAFEVQAAASVRDEDLRSLRKFGEEHPSARLRLLHPGARRWHDRGVEVVPFDECVRTLGEILGA